MKWRLDEIASWAKDLQAKDGAPRRFDWRIVGIVCVATLAVTYALWPQNLYPPGYAWWLWIFAVLVARKWGRCDATGWTVALVGALFTLTMLQLVEGGPPITGALVHVLVLFAVAWSSNLPPRLPPFCRFNPTARKTHREVERGPLGDRVEEVVVGSR